MPRSQLVHASAGGQVLQVISLTAPASPCHEAASAFHSWLTPPTHSKWDVRLAYPDSNASVPSATLKLYAMNSMYMWCLSAQLLSPWQQYPDLLPRRRRLGVPSCGSLGERLLPASCAGCPSYLTCLRNSLHSMLVHSYGSPLPIVGT